MKTSKIIILILTFISSISFTSCVEEGNFEVPNALGTEENVKLNSILDSIQKGKYELKTISDVKALFTSGNNPLQIVSKTVVKGYVISSDQSGNFYQEFYMQDSPENPTTGIKVALNLNDNYNKFNIGREVYVYLKDLYIGETNSGDGVTAIGGKIKPTDTREIENISGNQLNFHLFRSEKTEVIVPKIVSLSSIGQHVSTFVTVQNVFFPDNLIGKSYVDPTEDFDTQRSLESCEGFGFVSAKLETSSFASFANNTLPKKAGTINAVVSKDFGGDFTVLVLNGIEDVNMVSDDRCTPLNSNDFTPVFQENFEAMTSTNPLGGNGWISFAQAGRFNWRVLTSTDSGNPNSKIASMGAFNSGNESNIAWMISPIINLNAQDLEFLNFQTSNSFADDSILEVLISTNWDGTTTSIATATWQKLPATIVSRSENFQNWVDSGAIDLSGFSGTAHIAFKYIGGDNAANTIDGTYEVDNVKILVRK